MDEAVKRKKLTPGGYLVLSVDLSVVWVGQGDIDATCESLIRSLDDSITTFLERYRQYLDLRWVELNLCPDDPAGSLLRLIDYVHLQLWRIHENRDKNPLSSVKGVRLPKHAV